MKKFDDFNKEEMKKNDKSKSRSENNKIYYPCYKTKEDKPKQDMKVRKPKKRV